MPFTKRSSLVPDMASFLLFCFKQHALLVPVLVLLGLLAITTTCAAIERRIDGSVLVFEIIPGRRRPPVQIAGVARAVNATSRVIGFRPAGLEELGQAEPLALATYHGPRSVGTQIGGMFVAAIFDMIIILVAFVITQAYRLHDRLIVSQRQIALDKNVDGL